MEDEYENELETEEEEYDISFEDAMKRLQEIVTYLENGEMPLDKSLAAFAEGVRLVKICNDKLENAEKTVKLLSISESGEVTEGEMPPMAQ